MARTISANSLAKLNQNLGTEPVIIVEIQWTDNGSIYTYADSNINVNEGKILEVGDLDNTVTIQGVNAGTSGDSQQIRVVLDDIDGSIKTIMDQNDIHKQPAWVYQWFEGMDLDDKFMLFKGQISSPIQWNERDRTVSFDILTRIEDAEVGFSMEEGNFQNIPEELVGQPWPLVFGTVINMPALRTRTPRKGVLREGVGIKDFMLEPRLEQLGKVCCPWIFTGYRTYYVPAFGGAGYSLRRDPQYQKDVSCECNKRAQELDIQQNITVQSSYENDTVAITGGQYFAQGISLTFDIKGARITGYFNGTTSSPSDTFVITNRVHPRRSDITVPPIINFGCPALPPPAPQGPNNTDPTPGLQSCVLIGEQFNIDDAPVYQVRRHFLIESGNDPTAASLAYLSQFRQAGFFWAEVGTEVTLVNDTEISYVVNILPSTVLRVAAYKNFPSGIRQLTTVPSSYYTTRISNFNGYMVTEVVLTKPLSSYANEGWEDDVYVTHTSSVGPNTVDIIEWLVDKYTDFSVDPTTFNDLNTRLDNYPMNFVVPGRPNILELLQEIAFQARCALVLRNDVFYLYYLSDEPAEDGTITESDVLVNTLVLDHTNTEELVTKLTAEWRYDLALDDPNRVIVRHNVDRYGTQAQSFNFFCYNIQELVLKSATFWLIRMANTWRKIRCQVPIKHLTLESLDGVYVTLPDIASQEIKCRVETAVYNSEDHSVDMVIWTPVKAGTTVPYVFAYPANVSVEEIFPTVEEFQSGAAGGSGPNVDVTPPQGHVLGEGPSQTNISVQLPDRCDSIITPDINSQCRPDQGDHVPSDQDDTKPEVNASAGSATPPSQSPNPELTINEFADAQDRLDSLEAKDQQQQNQITQVQSQGNENGDDIDDLENPDGTDFSPLDDLPDESELPPCKYGVRVTYGANVEAVFTDDGIVTVEQDPGAVGGPAIFDNSASSETYWFCSLAERDEFRANAAAFTGGREVQNGASSFVQFYSNINPPGDLECDPNECGEDEEGIIGYDATNKGQEGRTDSLLNYGDSGFLTEDGLDPDWDGVIRA